MGKVPASLFYWGDVARDPDLRRCTHAEVGVWFRILCLMFEAESKGMLATNGEPWTDDEIALALGGDPVETKRCVTALVTKGVASRNERGALINRRMHREHLERVATRERVRLFRERQEGNEDVTLIETEVKRESTMRAHAETETETETVVTATKKKPDKIPDWIPQESWDGFVENRKALRSPMTARAVAMIVKELDVLRSSGQDPGAILDQSTTNGWKGVFALKRGVGNGKRNTAVDKQERTLDNFKEVLNASGRYAARHADDADGGVLPKPGVKQADDHGVSGGLWPTRDPTRG